MTMIDMPRTNAALAVQIFSFVRKFIRDIGSRIPFALDDPWALLLDRPQGIYHGTAFDDLIVVGIMHIGGDDWQPILSIWPTSRQVAPVS